MPCKDVLCSTLATVVFGAAALLADCTCAPIDAVERLSRTTSKTASCTTAKAKATAAATAPNTQRDACKFASAKAQICDQQRAGRARIPGELEQQADTSLS
jgi:hypothetical protein